MKVLVTGTAGVIGLHLALKLLERGDEGIGCDSMSDCCEFKYVVPRELVGGCL